MTSSSLSTSTIFQTSYSDLQDETWLAASFQDVDFRIARSTARDEVIVT
jgi:hypothetical protein